MENSDEISGDEINRVQNLERVVQKFRLAVAGDGKVMGGFGKSFKPPEELTLEERVMNLETATNGFDLVGDNVDIAGSFDDGFSIS